MGDDEDRVSLAGVDPERALRALLSVDPDAPPDGDHDEAKQPPSKPAEPDEGE
jgi:hypothetical protein